MAGQVSVRIDDIIEAIDEHRLDDAKRMLDDLREYGEEHDDGVNRLLQQLVTLHCQTMKVCTTAIQSQESVEAFRLLD